MTPDLKALLEEAAEMLEFYPGNDDEIQAAARVATGLRAAASEAGEPVRLLWCDLHGQPVSNCADGTDVDCRASDHRMRVLVDDEPGHTCTCGTRLIWWCAKCDPEPGDGGA